MVSRSRVGNPADLGSNEMKQRKISFISKLIYTILLPFVWIHARATDFLKDYGIIKGSGVVSTIWEDMRRNIVFLKKLIKGIEISGIKNTHKGLLIEAVCCLFHRKYYKRVASKSYDSGVTLHRLVTWFRCDKCGREWQEVIDFWR